MSHTYIGLFCLLLTLTCYYASKALYRRQRKIWFAPIIIAPATILVVVVTLNIDVDDYFSYSHWLAAMLAPATIAFALPIYRERQLIKQYPLTLSLGVLTGLLMGLASSWLLVKLTHLPPELAHSLMVRSVSTPFAVEATHAFGGVPELTAMLVLLTGIIGMLICEPLFKVAKINSSIAKGVALGASAHGAGAAKASELGRQEGVIASLTMIFTGIVMVIAAPFFASIIN
ncbi:murein hydrolase effector protein LrgB [Shewanella sairae]|uniref:Murein hydrolase effector protein LrgB n=1 Tax=Shewanella sairae TaxID=190310 RepID=A0ABQ4P2C5_9GAMM|nr:LrgB family protein [Shewanella sairae]MCL1128304.1 LrgB family protein [Shewanella sairae]GIU41657.1 murein hydrolase effector protein LrgB [Shewanella sairae]